MGRKIKLKKIKQKKKETKKTLAPIIHQYHKSLKSRVIWNVKITIPEALILLSKEIHHPEKVLPFGNPLESLILPI